MQGTLDLAYYPNAKGPYNTNPDFATEVSENKWGGIMRSLSSTDFEQSNVEFVQFWVLDPYVDGIATSPGELVRCGNCWRGSITRGRETLPVRHKPEVHCQAERRVDHNSRGAGWADE